MIYIIIKRKSNFGSDEGDETFILFIEKSGGDQNFSNFTLIDSVKF